ncbi:MAG: 4-phosphopantetheinyl transferase [Bryobacterales bacterium]|nr:4-phosphopantetheinyl transferase [Bryobacterales bacterium]
MDGEPDDQLSPDMEVWTYRISGAERCDELMHLLSDEETARHGRFLFEKNRREFLCAHSLLRLALSRYAGGEPRAWEFETAQWGKPYLRGAKDLQFNISHTEGFVACAIARGHEVGVDVERVERSVEVVEIAGRFFADEEAKYIESLAAEQQQEAFFRIWTLKEAYIKGCGRGFDLPLKDFWFELRDEGVRLSPPGDWTFWEFTPASGYRMAVAARGESKLRLRDGAALFDAT